MAYKKGESGNPGGRSREKPFRDALNYLRRQPAIFEKDKEFAIIRRKKNAPVEQELMRQLLLKGLAGDIGAIKETMDRVDGKVAQPVQGSDEPDAPPIPVKDLSSKELARRLAFVLLDAQPQE